MMETRGQFSNETTLRLRVYRLKLCTLVPACQCEPAGLIMNRIVIHTLALTQ